MSDRQYAGAGVDLRQLDSAKVRIARAVAGARTALSVGEVGAFGGMLRIPTGMRSPILVMSTDGVGTKVLVARMAGVWDTVGEDLVNHSVNDILVHGARGIGFQDYVGSNGLTEDQLAGLVEGVARGCRAHEMALTGETAAMPSDLQPRRLRPGQARSSVVRICRPPRRPDRGGRRWWRSSPPAHTNGYTPWLERFYSTGCNSM
ncbi:MAG: AIR synthase related protein [Gemmatimonadales bacterium]